MSENTRKRNLRLPNAVPANIISSIGPSGIIGPTGSAGTLNDGTVHLEKNPVFVGGREVVLEMMLDFDGLRDTAGVADGVLWPSRPLGKTVLYNLLPCQHEG